MQPTCPKPAGSVAQRLAGGAPPTPRSPFTFHGRRHDPIATSSTRLPSGRGSLHGQQKPAVMRAPYPSEAFNRKNSSSPAGDSDSRSSKYVSPSQVTGSPGSRPSSRSTHSSYVRLPPHRN